MIIKIYYDGYVMMDCYDRFLILCSEF